MILRNWFDYIENEKRERKRKKESHFINENYLGVRERERRKKIIL